LSEKFWYKVARVMIKAGTFPLPVTDTLIELIKVLLTEEQGNFILKTYRRKPSLNIDEIKKISGMDGEQLDKMLESLMLDGIVVGHQSRSTGIMVYRLMPLAPAGIFEFTFMRGKSGEKELKLVKLFDKLFDEFGEATQQNYDSLIPQFKKMMSPISRVVPVEEEIEVPQEKVLPYDEASKIVDKYDDISISYCYCRHEKDLLGEPCSVTDERQNCFMFGKSAVFAIKYGFGNPVSKVEAKAIIKKAADEGLVHKAFHIHQDPNKDEEAFCNCCKCCCGISQLYYKGCVPMSTLANYLPKVNEDDCVGCGTCTEKCPMEAITLEDDIANINEDICIGCGVCAHICPENAINLEFHKREVFVPPPRLKN
jgi:Pyruvate/2-oxoacid:ferredoxin oxidoreductase delta subunit